MTDFQLQNHEVSNSFDQDYGQAHELVVHKDHSYDVMKWNTFDSSFVDNKAFFDYQDPLKHVYKFNFKPCVIDIGNDHFVKPHAVKGYFKKDGTYVDAHFRDGDGDSSIDRTVNQGGGYMRTNPDGIMNNNYSNKL